MKRNSIFFGLLLFFVNVFSVSGQELSNSIIKVWIGDKTQYQIVFKLEGNNDIKYERRLFIIDNKNKEIECGYWKDNALYIHKKYIIERVHLQGISIQSQKDEITNFLIRLIRNGSFMAQIYPMSNWKSYIEANLIPGKWEFVSYGQRIEAQNNQKLKSNKIQIIPGKDYNGGFEKFLNAKWRLSFMSSSGKPDDKYNIEFYLDGKGNFTISNFEILFYNEPTLYIINDLILNNEGKMQFTINIPENDWYIKYSIVYLGSTIGIMDGQYTCKDGQTGWVRLTKL